MTESQSGELSGKVAVITGERRAWAAASPNASSPKAPRWWSETSPTAPTRR